MSTPARVDYNVHTNCRLCGENLTSQKPSLALPSTPLANSFCKTREEAVALPKYPLCVYACPKCGHHQLSVVVDPKLMFSNYAYASGTAASFRQHFQDYAHEIVKRRAPVPGPGPLGAPPPRFRVLELGSNDGTMMKALFAAGATHVLGVEPAYNLAMQCIGEGLNVTCAFFNEEVATHPKMAEVDFWVANNVLAHIDGFVPTLNALALTGARGGVFEVQYLGSLLDTGTFDMVYHEHLDYWRATELVKQLHRYTPWFVVDVELVPTHGGSLRVWVVRHPEGQNPEYHTPDLEVFHMEHRRDWAASWGELREKMDAERKRLWAMLGDNKTVAIYGAPAKLTTLLYGLQLTNLNFQCVIDDSPLKQGLFTPGMGLEVKPAGYLVSGGFKPDAVLVGAWNFAPYIVPRLHDLLGGTPIVVPFSRD